jgi:membrane-associated protein
MLDFLKTAIEHVLHLNNYLDNLATDYGAWLYAIMFVVVFCETGLVITPFLPGDSLLFAAGAIAATTGALNPWLIILVLGTAAVLGDAANYSIGKYLGPKVFHYQRSLLFNPEHLNRAHRFYEKYGGKTIIIARFVPIIRTFAPFVAGIGTMSYRRFAVYNVTGAALWVIVVTWAGYAFGNVPFVKNNFSAVIMAIIVISVMPAVIEYFRQRRQSARKPAPAAQPGETAKAAEDAKNENRQG